MCQTELREFPHLQSCEVTYAANYGVWLLPRVPSKRQLTQTARSCIFVRQRGKFVRPQNGLPPAIGSRLTSLMPQVGRP